MTEYPASHRPHEILYMHNPSLHGTLNKCSPFSSYGPLGIQRHVVVKFCNELKDQELLERSGYISVYEQVFDVSINDRHKYQIF